MKKALLLTLALGSSTLFAQEADLKAVGSDLCGCIETELNTLSDNFKAMLTEMSQKENFNFEEEVAARLNSLSEEEQMTFFGDAMKMSQMFQEGSRLQTCIQEVDERHGDFDIDVDIKTREDVDKFIDADDCPMTYSLIIMGMTAEQEENAK